MGLFPDVEDLSKQRVPIEIDMVTAICIIGSIQLALRHPKHNGPSAQIAHDFARDLQKIVVEKFPAAAFTLEAGWNPDFDIE